MNRISSTAALVDDWWKLCSITSNDISIPGGRLPGPRGVSTPAARAAPGRGQPRASAGCPAAAPLGSWTFPPDPAVHVVHEADAGQLMEYCLFWDIRNLSSSHIYRHSSVWRFISHQHSQYILNPPNFAKSFVIFRCEVSQFMFLFSHLLIISILFVLFQLFDWLFISFIYWF